MTPTPALITTGLQAIDDDLQHLIPCAAEHGNPETMTRMLQWQEVVQSTLTHLRAQESRIEFLEQELEMLPRGAAE